MPETAAQLCSISWGWVSFWGFCAVSVVCMMLDSIYANKAKARVGESMMRYGQEARTKSHDRNTQ